MDELTSAERQFIGGLIAREIIKLENAVNDKKSSEETRTIYRDRIANLESGSDKIGLTEFIFEYKKITARNAQR